MAKSWYRTTFADGSYVDKEADTADQAKGQSKNERAAEVDPARSLPTADLRRHNRVQVTSVRELTDEERTAKTAATRRAKARNDANGRNDGEQQPPATEGEQQAGTGHSSPVTT